MPYTHELSTTAQKRKRREVIELTLREIEVMELINLTVQRVRFVLFRCLCDA